MHSELYQLTHQGVTLQGEVEQLKGKGASLCRGHGFGVGTIGATLRLVVLRAYTSCQAMNDYESFIPERGHEVVQGAHQVGGSMHGIIIRSSRRVHVASNRVEIKPSPILSPQLGRVKQVVYGWWMKLRLSMVTFWPDDVWLVMRR